MDAQMREELDRAVEPLEFTTPVPVGEVYGFVEALLTQHEVFLAHVKGGARPVLAVFGGQTRNVPRSPVVVPDADIEQLAGHPALLCQIVLHFENVDSRQLQTQLRQLLADQTGMLQVVPCGERSLLLQGPGSYLAGLARLLHDVDRASAARPSAPVTETQKPAGGSAK